VADLNEQQRYNLRHRELFFSKCTDTIAATTIRAKCSVLLFNEEIEKYSEYLSKEVSQQQNKFKFLFLIKQQLIIYVLIKPIQKKQQQRINSIII
jgi:hypothetical protein